MGKYSATNETVGIGEWLLLMLAMSIPIVNIIVFIALLIMSSTKPSMKNLLIAALIWILIMGGLIFAFGGAMLAALSAF